MRDLDAEELARLLDLAERARVDGWSLRAALTRYAQPQPLRASAIMELVRRIEFAVRPHAKALEAGRATGPDGLLEGLAAAMGRLDRLGDTLATWAVDRQGARPDVAVDEAVAEVTMLLDSLGVPREERVRPPTRSRG